jgi:hypothetical protein
LESIANNFARALSIFGLWAIKDCSRVLFSKSSKLYIVNERIRLFVVFVSTIYYISYTFFFNYFFGKIFYIELLHNEMPRRRFLTLNYAKQASRAYASLLGYNRSGRSSSAASTSTSTVQGFAIGMAIHRLVSSGL